MGGLGEFGALFNPGIRHEIEERRAKQMLREEEGNARKGRLGIDLDSGVALIPSGRNGDVAGRDQDAASTAAAPEPRDTAGAPNPRGTAGAPNPRDTAGAGSEDSEDARDSEDADDGGGGGAPGRSVGSSPARPGRPQHAVRSAGAVPSGKARRRATPPPPAEPAPHGQPAPHGKPHRAR